MKEACWLRCTWFWVLPVVVGCDGGNVVVSPRGELITDEHGAEVIIDVALASPPTAVVRVFPETTDSTEAIVSPRALSFTPANWASPQPVTIRGVGDLLADGTVAYSLRLTPNSRDPAYASLLPKTLELKNLDRAAFSGIGDLRGGDSSSAAVDVSGDGTHVVGRSVGGGGQQAILWTPEDGIVSLGGVSSEAHAVSAAGDVIVGAAADAAGESKAVEWLDGVGPAFLPLPDEILVTSSVALGVSGDGRVVLGSAFQLGAGPVGATWKDGVHEHFGIPSYLTGASADGSVVVGYRQIFRYVVDQSAYRAGSPLPFPDDPQCQDPSCLCLTPLECEGHAFDVSADGRVVVGSGWMEQLGYRAAKWIVDAGGAVEAVLLAHSAEALGVSHDGTLVVGYKDDGGGPVATIWNEDGSSEAVAHLLGAANVGLDGWVLTAARSASADGRVIVGEGINPSGAPEGWMAVLPPSPGCGSSCDIALAD